MSRTLLAVALIAAAGTAASAGTYVGLGIGTAANAGTSPDLMATGEGRSGRLVLGMRFGRVSIEGAGSRYGLYVQGAPGNAGTWDTTQLAAAVKLSFPLGNNFELFGRGGLERSYLSTNTGSSYSGNGYLLGAGFEYRLDFAVAAGSIFVDYERSATTFATDGSGGQFDATAGMFTLGATMSL